METAAEAQQRLIDDFAEFSDDPFSLYEYLLGFAAGAMLYVVVEELIPEMSQGRHSNAGTLMFAVGFSLMMVLDVALG